MPHQDKRNASSGASSENPWTPKLRFLKAAMGDPSLGAAAKNVLTVLVIKFHDNKTGVCLREWDGTAAAAALDFQISTGVRPGNVVAARWNHMIASRSSGSFRLLS
jgi:hypothetical protein